MSINTIFCSTEGPVSYNMLYLLLFHCNDDCTNAPQCYVIRTSPDLLVRVCVGRCGFWVPGNILGNLVPMSSTFLFSSEIKLWLQDPARTSTVRLKDQSL